MKQKNIALVIVLSIFTFGIYYLYWLYDASKDLRSRGHDSPKVYLLLLPVLGIFGGFLLFAVSNFLLGGAENSGGAAQTLINIVLFVVGLLSILSALPITIWWGYKFAGALEKASDGAIERNANFIIYIITLLVGLSVVWQAVTQSQINQIASTGASNNNQSEVWG